MNYALQEAREQMAGKDKVRDVSIKFFNCRFALLKIAN